MEHDDDLPVGRILKRRELLTLLGGAGVVILGGCAINQAGATTQATSTAGGSGGTATTTIPGCVVRPEMTEGPYFVDEKLNRSDIRSDPSDGSTRPGAQLDLTFRLARVGATSCAPLAGATVDVWHCDALGVYSDVSDPGFTTTGKKFLRGYQVSDASGLARFTTIYPGWYQGRTVHIHFKIRGKNSSGTAYTFTSQLFFDDALSDQVFAQPPYASKGRRTLKNAGDGIYSNGGSQLLLSVTKTAQGYAATFDIGVQVG